MPLIFVLLLGIFTVVFATDSNANPIRTQDISNICSTKTDTVRNVSEKTKQAIYKRDGVPDGNYTGMCRGIHGCEVDHRISLELGGSNEEDNLMIQPYDGPCNAHDKDKLENRLHRLLCAGEIQINTAQQLLYNHWIDGYRKYIDSKGCDGASQQIPNQKEFILPPNGGDWISVDGSISWRNNFYCNNV